MSRTEHRTPGERAPETYGTFAAPPGGGEDAMFDAVITPHRSLTRRGFAILMSAIGFFSFATGLAFAFMGAWPVMGFFGIDVALIYWAFRLNFRSARAFEHVLLTRDMLFIRRSDPRGRVVETRIQPYWLRVSERGGEGPGEIRLTSHGRTYSIGAWLTAQERGEFLVALESALQRLRTPPHLAEEADAPPRGA
jgi:uncharacterized membrane protein